MEHQPGIPCQRNAFRMLDQRNYFIPSVTSRHNNSKIIPTLQNKMAKLIGFCEICKTYSFKTYFWPKPQAWPDNFTCWRQLKTQVYLREVQVSKRSLSLKASSKTFLSLIKYLFLQAY